MSHTPTPWRFRAHHTFVPDPVLLGADGRTVAEVFEEDRSQEEDEANAEFIVRAVNNHEALLDLAKRALHDNDTYGYLGADVVQGFQRTVDKIEGRG